MSSKKSKNNEEFQDSSKKKKKREIDSVYYLLYDDEISLNEKREILEKLDQAVAESTDIIKPEPPEFNPKNRTQAWERLTKGDKIPVGLIYVEEKPSYGELVLPDKDHPLVYNDLSFDSERFEKIMEGFK